MSHFQAGTGSHDVRPPLAAAHPEASAGCLLAHRARVYSSWSIEYSYLFHSRDYTWIITNKVDR